MMKHSIIRRGLAAFATMAVLAAGPAAAGSISVSSNGLDSATCGAGVEPACATLAQAVANAADGDTISVGPGSYAGATINKPVSLSSSVGGGGAVITSGMVLAADGIEFGKLGRGFSLAGAATEVAVAGNDVVVRGNFFSNCTTGIQVVSGSDVIIRDNSFDDCATGVSVLVGTATQIRGNRFGSMTTGVFLASGSSGAVIRENRTFGPNGVGFSISGSDHVLWRNLVHGTPGGGFVTTGTPTNVELRENLVVSPAAPGIYLTGGSGWILNRNAVVNSAGPGFYLTAGAPFVLTGNVAIGNGSYGIFIGGGSDHVLTGNSALQNTVDGLVLSTVGTGTQVIGGNLYGNGNGNCGLSNGSASVVTTTGVYWGDAAGPGADPADAVCANVASVVINAPAGTAAKVKMPGIK